MVENFNNFFEKKDVANLQDDITALVKDGDDYVKAEEPMELVQVTGILTDEEEIKKIEEGMTIDKSLNLGEVKRGEIIWLTALLKKPGTSYNNQTLGVIKVRVVDYFYGLSKLNQVMK